MPMSLLTTSSASQRYRSKNAFTLPILLTGSLAVGLGITAPIPAAHAETKDESHEPERTPAPARTPSTVPTEVAPVRYTVVSGDTVSGIAARFGLATASVLALNGLSWSTLIFPGQVLSLSGASASPDAGPPPAPAPPATPAPPAAGSYTVISGDTLSRIASAHGVSLSALFAANGLGGQSIIYPGQTIVIPGTAQAAPSVPNAPVTAPVAPPAAPPAAETVTPLSAEMRANATIIVQTGRSVGASDHAIIIALAAAMQESNLINVGSGDRDSLGLFQQRPSQGWGTAEQVLDPVRATLAFFGGSANPNPGVTIGLFDVPGWQTLSLTQAAQAVQKSAHPDSYAIWEVSATAWLAELG